MESVISVLLGVIILIYAVVTITSIMVMISEGQEGEDIFYYGFLWPIELLKSVKKSGLSITKSSVRRMFLGWRQGEDNMGRKKDKY